MPANDNSETDSGESTRLRESMKQRRSAKLRESAKSSDSTKLRESAKLQAEAAEFRARVHINETTAWSAGSGPAFLVAAGLLAALSGFVYLVVVGAIASADGFVASAAVKIAIGVVGVVVVCSLGTCFYIVSPGETSVRQFFGKYIGTVRRTGLVLIPPFTYG